ncbi:MAG: hypothetical protein EOO35_00615 [Cyanobacteriota bacterium]|nr:MAG: hypothetical protein EOO35_00615 [Cyanobacteriota bacterium]
MAKKNITEYRYYNPDTNKEYFFLEKDFYVIRTKIDDLVFEYLMLRPEFLSLEENDGLNYIIVQGIKNFELDNFFNLSLLLSQRSNDKAKRLDILARLFLLSKHQLTLDVSYEKLATVLGFLIIEFCVTRCKTADISLILSNFNVKSLSQMTTDSNIHFTLAKPLLDYYLSVMPERFFLKKGKFVNDFLSADVCDLSMDLILPRVFTNDKSNAYRINLKKFFFFLQDLDDYRIRLDEKKLNEKVFRIKYLKQFEQMCIRFKTLEAYEKVRIHYELCIDLGGVVLM